MKPEDAAKKLLFHLMQCGMMMPMEWIRENGEGSELQQAFRMALDALQDGERLRAELEQARAEITRLKYYEDKCHDCPIVCAKTEIIKAHEELETVQAELEQVKRERDAAKPKTVIEAVDELMEFARTRMNIVDWLYYVEVLGEWRGQREG